MVPKDEVLARDVGGVRREGEGETVEVREVLRVLEEGRGAWKVRVMAWALGASRGVRKVGVQRRAVAFEVDGQGYGCALCFDGYGLAAIHWYLDVSRSGDRRSRRDVDPIGVSHCDWRERKAGADMHEAGFRVLQRLKYR